MEFFTKCSTFWVIWETGGKNAILPPVFKITLINWKEIPKLKSFEISNTSYVPSFRILLQCLLFLWSPYKCQNHKVEKNRFFYNFSWSNPYKFQSLIAYSTENIIFVHTLILPAYACCFEDTKNAIIFFHIFLHLTP